MPGSVANAAPVEVFPKLLCSAFRRTQAWAVEQVDYRNGESEVRSRVSIERRQWELTARLTADQLEDLKDFIADQKHAPFYFYDLFHPVSGQAVGSNYDPAGEGTQGRYIVRLDGTFSQQMNLGRFDANLRLVEVA